MFIPPSFFFLLRLFRLPLVIDSAADPSALKIRAHHRQRSVLEPHHHHREPLLPVSFSWLCILFLCFCCELVPGVSAAGESLSSPATSPLPLPSLPPLASPSPALAPQPPKLRPSASEVSSLLSLKAHWLDPSNSLASWSFSSAGSWVCGWIGVLCSEDNSTIISLILPSLSLSGPLHPAIANLSSLRSLNLAFNQLTGNIPEELGSLSLLKTLQLRHNLLNGSIPESIYELTSLQFLLLENNSLTGEGYLL
ncbi:hypothetical protein GOP47_0030404 [Adiantum capillus-veneris]|nr:hypothetical protein GOP47_0030404 [Adiantum capillus-veneris]